MAFTNAYYSIVRIPLNSGDGDDASFTGTTPLASGNSAQFKLKGGLYGVDLVVTGSGTFTLKRLAQDGSTYNTTLAALTANGYVTIYLPYGLYRVELG